MGEGSLWILGFGVASRPNPASGVLKSTLPEPRDGSSILNVDLVVMTAAVLVTNLSRQGQLLGCLDGSSFGHNFGVHVRRSNSYYLAFAERHILNC